MSPLQYTVRFDCFSKPEENIVHQTNSYEQAEHFVWAMILKLKSSSESWQLTMEYQEETKHSDKASTFKTCCKYHFLRY